MSNLAVGHTTPEGGAEAFRFWGAETKPLGARGGAWLWICLSVPKHFFGGPPSGCLAHPPMEAGLDPSSKPTMLAKKHCVNGPVSGAIVQPHPTAIIKRRIWVQDVVLQPGL